MYRVGTTEDSQMKGIAARIFDMEKQGGQLNTDERAATKQ
jgi:hypothetical protein